MKTCRKCKIEKELAEFSANKRRKDGLQGDCKPCMKAYKASHYQGNKPKVMAGNAKRAQANRDKLWEYKQGKSCKDCGFSNPMCLEFDHVADDKLHNVASMMGGYSWSTILTEIQKCEIVCANCHRIRTATRAGWVRNIRITF